MQLNYENDITEEQIDKIKDMMRSTFCNNESGVDKLESAITQAPGEDAEADRYLLRWTKVHGALLKNQEPTIDEEVDQAVAGG